MILGGMTLDYANPAFGICLTLVAYLIALQVHRKIRWMNPLLLTCILIMVLLKAKRIRVEAYEAGGNVLKFLLGPATIALGVPLYRQAQKLKGQIRAIAVAVTVGSICGLVSGALMVWIARGSHMMMLTMMPKSVTTAISIEIAGRLGAKPELTAVFTVLTGLLGSIAGPAMLRLARIRSDIAIGLAMGTSAHGIGTARVIRDSELQGSASGLAMAMAGIITSILAIPLYHL